jgi:hypothetical protein
VIQLILFLVVAALLLFALSFLARRPARPAGGAEAMLDANRALSSLQMELLPPEMITRIFATEDLDYVKSVASEEVLAMFLADRERIALSWVRFLRQNLLSLRRFHLGSARLYAGLSFRAEVSLAVDFAILLFACRVLEIILRLRGPYGAPQIVRATALGAARVCQISENSLVLLRSGSAPTFGSPPAGNSATP